MHAAMKIKETIKGPLIFTSGPEMTKMFGMKENSINMYNNIYKLSKEVTIARDSNIDTTTLSGIQQAKHWNKVHRCT